VELGWWIFFMVMNRFVEKCFDFGSRTFFVAKMMLMMVVNDLDDFEMIFWIILRWFLVIMTGACKL
jgi:hypothetical protein